MMRMGRLDPIYGNARHRALRSCHRETDGDVKTLRAVLAAAHIEPPFVLVVYSWAGPIAERFACDYRDSVAGIVLVDSQQADVIGKWLAMLPPAPRHGVVQSAQVRAELKQASSRSTALGTSMSPRASLSSVRCGRSAPCRSSYSRPGTSQLASALPVGLDSRSYQSPVRLAYPAGWSWTRLYSAAAAAIKAARAGLPPAFQPSPTK